MSVIAQLKNPDLVKTGAYIDGQWQSLSAYYAVTNPANGELLAQVAQAGAEATELAIIAAEKALPAWRAKTAKQRAVILRKWADLMLANQEDLAQLMSAEQGKPIAEARGEVQYASSFLEWFAEEAKRAYGDVIPSHKADAKILVMKEPVGVVAAITPWNFPLAMVTRKVGPALAAGCTVVLKPSEETPLSSHALAVLGEQAGVPEGVFNIVSGDAPAIGNALMSSSVVRKLSFTGSTRVGKLLMRQAADTLKKVSLELGGNAPFIVFDDADIDAAVIGAMASKFRNTGQTCVCVNRFYVQDAVFDTFTQKLTAAVQKLKVGSALEEGVTQGPLINQAALAKVERHVADAVAKGARVLTGGKMDVKGGTFYE
ncbi:MAG: NAD-dependent succinate-semialdehyde dehydrogenase, partial [Glaciimonas sp.]|nr:NAD-dependent succinate-semialdehyde dehydrogenase [Glaciimonas sp.]